jgi:hypothetical protein
MEEVVEAPLGHLQVVLEVVELEELLDPSCQWNQCLFLFLIPIQSQCQNLHTCRTSSP